MTPPLVQRLRERRTEWAAEAAAHLETFNALERAFLFICSNHPLGPTDGRTEAGKLIDSLRVPLATARDLIYPEEEAA